jgi:hypothetical protein
VQFSNKYFISFHVTKWQVLCFTDVTCFHCIHLTRDILQCTCFISTNSWRKIFRNNTDLGFERFGLRRAVGGLVRKVGGMGDQRAPTWDGVSPSSRTNILS